MKWFFSLNEGALNFAEYSDMIKVAVHTARSHTSLEPVFLFDGAPCKLTAWLEAQGARVFRRRWALLEEYRRTAVRRGYTDLLDAIAGVFLRVEVPRVCAENGWENENVLYTDCDVMFTGDPLPLFPGLRGRFFAAAPESDASDPEDINSGVMLMNASAMIGMDAAFETFVRRHMETCTDFTIFADQPVYRAFFRRGWTSLPLALNWKPYWGPNHEARIIHFHGPKPFMRPALANGTAAPIHLRLAHGIFSDCCAAWDRALEEAG